MGVADNCPFTQYVRKNNYNGRTDWTSKTTEAKGGHPVLPHNFILYYAVFNFYFVLSN